MRRLLPLLMLPALVTCSDSAGIDFEARVRVLGIVGVPGEVVEYTAPPLREVRRMPLISADTALRTLASAGAGSAFYAVAEWPWQAASTGWELRLYDTDWELVQVRAGADLVSDATRPSFLARTPDGAYLVAELLAPFGVPGTHDLLIMNAVTLATVRRIAASGRTLYTGTARTAATGSQVLLRRPGCPGAFIWLNVASGDVIDSVPAPCAKQFLGANAAHQLYLGDVGTGRIDLYDGSMNVVASAPDTIRGAYLMLPDPDRQQLIGLAAGLLFFDPATLHLRDYLLLGDLPSPPVPQTAFIHPATGLFVATTFEVTHAAEKGFAGFPGFIVVDLAGQRVIRYDSLVDAIDLVR